MSAYGFALIFGRPLPIVFARWARRNLQHIRGVCWASAETLHATVVNCTPPRGRSVSNEEAALSTRNDLRRKAEDYLVPVLRRIDYIQLEFTNVTLMGRNVILPSVGHPALGDLKRALQGNMFVVPEENVVEAFARPDLIGIDKFSTETGTLQPTVSVTLGQVEQILVEFTGVPTAPGFAVEGLRMVFYRERTLRNTVTSALLEFGDSPTKANGNKDRIARFFDGLA